MTAAANSSWNVRTAVNSHGRPGTVRMVMFSSRRFTGV